MFYFLFGITLGTFFSALITQYYSEEARWIEPVYLFWLSGILLIITVYIGWPLLQRVFS